MKTEAQKKEYYRQWYEKNKERHKANVKKYYYENKAYISKKRISRYREKCIYESNEKAVKADDRRASVDGFNEV